MQLFQVSDKSGALIMNAPLETIRLVFGLQDTDISYVLMNTRTLSQECKLTFLPAGEGPWHGAWPEVTIQRLPLEIPKQTPAIEQLAARMELVKNKIFEGQDD